MLSAVPDVLSLYLELLMNISGDYHQLLCSAPGDSAHGGETTTTAAQLLLLPKTWLMLGSAEGRAEAYIEQLGPR